MAGAQLSGGQSETLLHVLRERAGLTGTKKGCDLGECGPARLF
jgi:aerobic-type carbon monoxide dehydrogenase small subunit (CoxS/CutS family)